MRTRRIASTMAAGMAMTLLMATLASAQQGQPARMITYELTLTQVFQKISGTLKSGTTSTPIANGRLRGDEITFTAGGSNYTGRVTGNAMQGTIAGAGAGKWSASKVK